MDTVNIVFGAVVLARACCSTASIKRSSRAWGTTRGDGGINEGHTIFFVFLLSLITTLHDRYQPVYAYRRAQDPLTALRQE